MTGYYSQAGVYSKAAVEEVGRLLQHSSDLSRLAVLQRDAQHSHQVSPHSRHFIMPCLTHVVLQCGLQTSSDQFL